MELISLNVGTISSLSYRGRSVVSSFHKTPVEGPVYLGTNNLQGDKQADLVHHGGSDKAVLCYPIEHYPQWQEELGKTLTPPSFGENLTVRGMTEDEVCIGDIYSLGEVELQVTQPRQPCFKVSAYHGIEGMELRIRENGRSGFYLRVLKTGWIPAERPQLTLQVRDMHAVTVSFVNQVLFGKQSDEESIRRVLQVDSLAASLRSALERKLAAKQDQRMELR